MANSGKLSTKRTSEALEVAASVLTDSWVALSNGSLEASLTDSVVMVEAEEQVEPVVTKFGEIRIIEDYIKLEPISVTSKDLTDSFVMVAAEEQVTSYDELDGSYIMIPSSNKRAEVVIDVDTDENEEFEIIALPQKSKVSEFIAKHQGEIYEAGMFLYKSKASLGILLSTTTTVLYAPTFSMIAVASLAIAAAIEYSYTQKCDKTLTALGIISTVAGVGLGVPIIHKLAVAGLAGAAVLIGGTSAMTNPVVTSIVGFMMSIPGYILTNAASYSVYSLMSTETFKNTIKDAVQENVVQPIRYEAACQIQERVGCFRFLGIPFGRVAQRFISPIVNNAIDRVSDKVADGVDNIGNYGQSTILGQFQQLGEKYINNLVYLPKELGKYVERKFVDRITEQNGKVSTNMGEFLMV